MATEDEAVTVPPSSHPDLDALSALHSLRTNVLADLSDPPHLKSWPQLDAYLSDLCSHGLSTLSREPHTLSAESSRLRAQLQDVSCTNYRALISSFECAHAVRDGVTSIRTRLDALITALPPLASSTRHFSAGAAAAQAEREERLKTLADFGRVLDILEMPRLMRSLVAAELYEEALELYDTSVKFSRTHDDPVLRSVCAEVDALTRQMILQLVSVLRGQVQLPMCLRVVGFLRRLGVFSESRLRMLFLQCRGEWMRAALDTSHASSPQARLVRLCDDTRAMMFEIITQYRAAFADDEDEDGVGDFYVGESLAENAAVPTTAILFHWTSACTRDFLSHLEGDLKDIRDGASLSTVMQQAIYCGQSLGRVGADFRSALAPLFERAVLRILNSHLNSALRQFEMMVEDNRWSPVGSSALRKDRMRASTNPASSPQSGAGESVGDASPVPESPGVGSDNSGKGFEPPIAVLDSPPLAVFLNGILAALNEVRACALLSLSAEIAAKVSRTLVDAAECVTIVAGPGGAFLKQTDRPHFGSMRSSLRDLCVPHVARCVDRCMDQRGLVDVDAILRKMEGLFGQSVGVAEELYTREYSDRDRVEAMQSLNGFAGVDGSAPGEAAKDASGTVVV